MALDLNDFPDLCNSKLEVSDGINPFVAALLGYNYIFIVHCFEHILDQGLKEVWMHFA